MEFTEKIRGYHLSVNNKGKKTEFQALPFVELCVSFVELVTLIVSA